MSKKVLIVDDEADIRKLLRLAFENKGIEVIRAANGQQGYDMAMKHKIDLFIIDIQMPKINGYELCNMLRNEESTASIPIIMMSVLTSETDEETDEKTDEQWAKILKVEAYFSKPFEAFDLVEKATQILGE